MKIMAAIGGSKAYIYWIFFLQHALKHQTQDYKNNKKESMAYKKKNSVIFLECMPISVALGSVF